MAAFPNELSNGTTLERVSLVRPSRAVDGTMRYIDMGAATKYQIDAVVEGLTAVERDTLVDWLDTNETSDIDVTINSTTYRGQLVYDTPVKWTAEDVYFTVEFSLWAEKL